MATHELVSERELDDISLQHIAERADVPLSSVYHFFPKRESAFFLLARRYSEDFERLSETSPSQRPETWQAYIGDRVMASADYCNANPGVMRLLLGPFFSRELRRDHVTGIFNVAEIRARALSHYFRMPDVEDLVGCIATSIVQVDGVLSLSYVLHGRVTPHYAEEAARAAVSYLRSFLPEVIPHRDLCEPNAMI